MEKNQMLSWNEIFYLMKDPITIDKGIHLMYIDIVIR